MLSRKAVDRRLAEAGATNKHLKQVWLDGHCYVSGYVSGHRLLEVRLSAARRPQGILLRSTRTQASLLQLVQLCLCCDYCCNSAYLVCGNIPCFMLS